MVKKSSITNQLLQRIGRHCERCRANTLHVDLCDEPDDIRACIDCDCLVAGGPTRCTRCANERTLTHAKLEKLEQQINALEQRVDALKNYVGVVQDNLLKRLEGHAKHDERQNKIFRNKLQAVCKMVGDLQDMPTGSLRDRAANIEAQLSIAPSEPDIDFPGEPVWKIKDDAQTI